jgi:hypothetical protein
MSVILATWEVGLGESQYKGSPSKVFSNPISTNSWVQWHTHIIPDQQECSFKPAWTKKVYETPSQNNWVW